jgi:hypothetical protein
VAGRRWRLLRQASKEGSSQLGNPSGRVIKRYPGNPYIAAQFLPQVFMDMGMAIIILWSYSYLITSFEKETSGGRPALPILLGSQLIFS